MFIVRKIAIVTKNYPPLEGDDARFSYYLAKELTRLNVEVCIITARRAKQIQEKKRDDVCITYLPAQHWLGSITTIKSNQIKTISEKLGKFKPDMVIINDYYRKLSVLSAKAANSLDLHTVLVSHLTSHRESKNAILRKLMSMQEHSRMKKLRKRPVLFAGTSQSQLDWINHFGINARYMITDAVETGYIPALGFRRRYGISKQAVLFAMSASEMCKMLGHAIEAFTSVSKWSGPEAVLAVYGKCDGHKKHASKNIIFTGDIPREDVHSLLDTADVYVSYNRKGQGISTELLEAATNSCAVLCINEQNTHLLLTEKTSIVVTKDDMEILTSKMQRLRVHSEIRQKMSERLKGEVDLKYNWNQTALTVIEIACELNDTRRRR